LHTNSEVQLLCDEGNEEFIYNNVILREAESQADSRGKSSGSDSLPHKHTKQAKSGQETEAA
jgi:hypothetical protein